MQSIELYLDHFIKVWENSPTHFPGFNRFYSETEKLEREFSFEQIQEKMKVLQSRSTIKKLRNSNPESILFFPKNSEMSAKIFSIRRGNLAQNFCPKTSIRDSGIYGL